MERKIKFDAVSLAFKENWSVLSLRITSDAVSAAKMLCDDVLQSDGKLYELTAKPHTEARSLSANAYCWVLCDKIAKALCKPDATVTKEDVYREAVRRVGRFDIVRVRNEAVQSLERHWQSNGIGNICDSLGESDGFTDLCMYHGSSTYNKSEMKLLLDDLTEEAEALGIQTLPPDEVARIESLLEG